MSPEDIRDGTQQEIAVMGYSAPGERALHDAYAAAGTTWWLESLHDRRGDAQRDARPNRSRAVIRPQSR